MVLLNLVTTSGTTSTKYEYRETGNEQAIHLSHSHQIFLKSSNTYLESAVQKRLLDEGDG